VRLDGEVDWWGWLARFVAEISRREHSNIQRHEYSKARVFKGPNSQRPEQSKAQTVKGPNIQRHEHSKSFKGFFHLLTNQPTLPTTVTPPTHGDTPINQPT
jgi:hypothetical protein